ncbi:MAG: M42 family metallopeptidase [Chloroflexota bacterium]|nr:M42 family metallopeptidase [Chloroflexota bacterium]
MTHLTIPLDPTIDFLIGLLNIPSPTGYHREANAYTRAAFEALNIPDLHIHETGKGALMLTWCGETSDKARGVTAHLDTLGLMVREIKANGRLKTSPIGGISYNSVESEGVTVRTFADTRFRGTAQMVNPSLHVNANLRTSERSAENIEIRLDAKTSSAADTRALGIDVGDFIFVDPRVEVTDTGFIKSRFLDDKAGVANIYGAIMALRDAGVRPAWDTEFLIANYEEVGHGGSSGWTRALTELLSIDMGALGESQNSDEFSVSICIKDASGPYHFDLTHKLRNLALQHAIPHKPDIYVFYSSDGSAYWRAGGDAQVALIGPGVEASHAYERTHRESILNTTHLLAQYLLSDS